MKATRRSVETIKSSEIGNGGLTLDGITPGMMGHPLNSCGVWGRSAGQWRESNAMCYLYNFPTVRAFCLPSERLSRSKPQSESASGRLRRSLSQNRLIDPSLLALADQLVQSQC